MAKRFNSLLEPESKYSFTAHKVVATDSDGNIIMSWDYSSPITFTANETTFYFDQGDTNGNQT